MNAIVQTKRILPNDCLRDPGKDKVYTEIIPDVSKKQLQAAIRGQVALDSSIHPDGWIKLSRPNHN